MRAVLLAELHSERPPSGPQNVAEARGRLLITPHPVAVGIETVGIASADANRPAEVRAVEVRRRWWNVSRGYATAPCLRPPPSTR